MQLTMRHFQSFRYRLPICGLSVLICLLAGLGSHIGMVHCLDACGDSELEFALGGLCVRPGLLGNEQGTRAEGEGGEAEHNASCADHAGAELEPVAACTDHSGVELEHAAACAGCFDPCGDCTDLSISGQQLLAQSGRHTSLSAPPVLAAQPVEDLLCDAHRSAARASIASFRPPPGQDPSHLQSSTILII